MSNLDSVGKRVKGDLNGHSLLVKEYNWVIENSWGLAKNDGDNFGEDREKRI